MEIGSKEVVKDFSKLSDGYAFILRNGDIVGVHFGELIGKPSYSKLYYGRCKLTRKDKQLYSLEQ